MKKLISIMLVVTMLIPAIVTYAAYGDYSLSDISYGEPYNYGTAIYDTTLTKGTTTYQDGKPVGITSIQGKPDLLQVIDLTTMELIDAIEIPGAESMCWQMETAPDGKVWFGDYNKCNLYMYDPETKQITDYGAVGTSAVVGLCFDDDGNVWISGNPAAALYKFDINTKQITKILDKKTDNSVGLSITYCNGKIYYTVLNTMAVELFAYDIKTGTEVSYPRPEGVKLLKYVQAKEDMIMIYCTLEDDQNGVVAFNTKTNTYTDIISVGEQGSRHFTPVIDGKVYFMKSNYAYGYDLKTGEVTKTNMKYGSILRGSDRHLVELPNSSDFPGLSYVNFQYNGGISIWNFTTGVIRQYKGMMKGSPAVLMTNRMHPSGKYYVTQFQGTQALELDITTGKRKTFPMSQATAIGFYGDNVYFANYSGGDLRKLDTTKDYGDINPHNYGDVFMEYQQQRVHNVIEAGDKLVFGSFPYYNMLGGAISVFDPTTEKLDIYRSSYSFTGSEGTENYVSPVFEDKLVNQSVLGMAYKDGKVYAGTSISGGLGINATETMPKIFVFDLETRKVEKIIDVDFIPGYENEIKEVSGMTIAPDGNLLCATYNFIFKLDIDTLELIDYVMIEKDFKYRADGQQHWYMTKLSYDEKTGFYFTHMRAGNGEITLFNPYTLDYIKTKSYNASYPELGPDGNLYYTDSVTADVIKLPVIRGNDRSYMFENRVMLKLGNPNAIVNGQEQAIDDNPVIKPFFCYDNVMLPLRYVSELFGYSIKWNEQENYALLYKDDDSIKITVGSRSVYMNGIEHKAPVQPRIKDGRIYVHINTISNIIGKTVYFDSDSRIMVVDKTTGTISESELNEIFSYANDYFKSK